LFFIDFSVGPCAFLGILTHVRALGVGTMSSSRATAAVSDPIGGPVRIDPRLRQMTFTTGARSAAVSVSLAAHAALIVVAAPHEPPRPLPQQAPASVIVELTSVALGGDAVAIAPPDAAPPAAAAPQRHAAPHEPRAKAASAAPAFAPMTSEPTNATAPEIGGLPGSPSIAHFTLAPMGQWSASLAAAKPKAAAQPLQADPEIVSERDVSQRAKLVSASEVSYPSEARAAEIEAEVPVEIVVAATGHVADARSLTRTGYGLDDAALRAIRGYRFEPALRAGRRVAVRMRWQVSFRLR
jgi:protein TonB